jgi:hypothetical protein
MPLDMKENRMNKPNTCLRIALIAGLALSLQAAPVFAEEGMPMKSGMMAGYDQHQDWKAHTKTTLDELKLKLNLRADQSTAWDTWSRGVMKDADHQLEPEDGKHMAKDHKAMAKADETTPERIASSIARLREETNWMQGHLTQLEAALARTKSFYEALDTNQRTIFDLFWREMHHRMGGYGGSGGMQESEHGQDACPMMEKHK